MRVSKLALTVVLGLGAGCASPAAPPVKRSSELAELGLLMKNRINPAFSKLSFLVFHGDEMDEDRDAIDTQLQTLVAALRSAIGQLQAYEHPPTESKQGREVFFTYASSLDQDAAQLELAIAGDDDAATSAALERIAKTCNSCHHFFRLEIKDAVGGPAATSPPP